jgi:hypothetical protein
MNWYLRDANAWAKDKSRYGARHRWQRRMALKDLHPAQLCVRCRRPLLPESLKDANGDYRIPRGWVKKNLHLDHRDGTDTGYNGLAHYDCNIRAAVRKRNPLQKDRP